MTFSHITIIGLGLMGGSLARDLKAQANSPHITACNRNKESLQTAQRKGLIDTATIDPAEAVQGAGLVIIGSPLSTYEPILKAIQPHLGKKAIVTDVGSVKSWVIDTAEKILTANQFSRFIPAHPIAGSEKSGVEAAIAGLYKDKRLIITPHHTINKTAMKEVKQLWASCGARVEMMEAARHDTIYAENSHLVQWLAYRFHKVVPTTPQGDPNVAVFTRLCHSNPAMWKDIFAYNDAMIHRARERFIHHFTMLRTIIENSDTEALTTQLSTARVLRHRIAPVEQKQPSTCPVSFMFLPHLIACALIHTVTERSYAGSGLKDFTENLLTWDTLNAGDFMQHSEEVLYKMEVFAEALLVE